MERFAAFLRGMNLGGRRIKNDELGRVVTGLGFDDVATFRASGNLLLTSSDASPERVCAALEQGLAEALGYEVPVFLRTADELTSLAAREPFTSEETASSKGKHQVILLRRRPTAPARRSALEQAGDDDRLALEGRELHWLPSGGISESDLDLKALEAALGPTTIRTKGTIDQIAARL